MLARDVPMPEIARQFGVTERTIFTWSRTAEARTHIAAIRASVREGTKSLAVADKVRRIAHAQTMLDGITAIIASRRAAGLAAAEALPGEATGHVAVKITEVTTGNRHATRTVVTREATFDAALHAEARKWQEYVAKELGDLDSGLTVRHSGTVEHVHRRHDLSLLTDDELEQLAALGERIKTGAVAS